MKTSHRQFLTWAAVCILGYLAAGKDSVGTTISDTCFLVGLVYLIFGLWRLIRKTGFFFIPRYSVERFLAIVTNRKWSREPMDESYQKHLRSFESDETHKTPLLIAAAMLVTSAVFTLL